MWRGHPGDIYFVEVTLPHQSPDQELCLPESRTLAFLKLLPSVSCASPTQTLKDPQSKKTGKDVVVEHVLVIDIL